MFFFAFLLLAIFYGLHAHVEYSDRSTSRTQVVAPAPPKKVEPAPKPTPQKKKKKEKAPKAPTRIVYGPEGEPENYSVNDRNSLEGIIIREAGHLKPSEGGIPL